jgi:beta-carotene 15,15'-dioxygenase
MTTHGADRDFARHRGIALVLTLSAVALMIPARELTVGMQLTILAIGLLSTGVPHGAVDHLRMAPVLRRRFGRFWLPAFLLAYVTITLAVAAAWMVWPVASLIVFLLLSLHHFGSGDAEDAIGIAIHGSVPILVPCAAHPDAVAELFAHLTASATSTWQATLYAAQPMIVVLISGLLTLLWAGRRACTGAMLEVLAIVAAGLTLPPLLSFTIYFCIWHAPRHILKVAGELRPGPIAASLGSFARAAMPMTLATAAMGTLAVDLLPSGQQPSARWLQVFFVGLAALTVPHLAVTDALRRIAMAPSASGQAPSR